MPPSSFHPCDYNLGMKLMRRLIALLLSSTLGSAPALAQVQSVKVSLPSASAASGAAGAISNPSRPGTPAFGALPSNVLSLSLSPSPAAPSIVPAAQPAALGIAPSVAVNAAAAVPASMPAAAPAKPAQAAAAAVASVQLAASKAVEGLSKASGDSASSKASIQFSALVSERLASSSRPDASLAPVDGRMAALTPSALSAKALPAPSAGEKAGPPAPKKAGITQVFKDPERNKAFWRYAGGYSIFLFGYQMYVVGLPYLISAITRNSLIENHDARAANEETLKAMIRSNRSLARIAHWVAQGISYATIPLFTRGIDNDGPKKWLVRSMLARAAMLAGVAGLFFATGLLSVTGAIWVFLGLVALQSFFQGIAVTFEGAATTRIMGDSSVTSEERTKANSILTFIAAIFAIVAPVIAGQIAQIGPVMGKTGVGGAVIYSIYAGAIALAALVYASIKIIGGAKKGDLAAKPAEEPGTSAAPNGVGGTLKSLWLSIKDGTKLVFKDRFLRTLLLMSMVTSLFSDPLVFNVLPEYIEGLVASNPGSVGAIMNIPVLGWILKSLTATPMGNFAMMMVMASVGSIVASLLIKPLTKLFQKFGFKTDEALTIPFFFLAALEAPLFLLMINTPTMLGAVALYGLQSLAVGFVGIAISGLYQKNLGTHKDENVNKILAAQSLLGIAAAILSTYVYGFVLKDISIATSLTIAAIATGVMGLLRLAAPFLSFSKESRRSPPPPDPPAPPAHAKPPSGDHHGPNSILSTHL